MSEVKRLQRYSRDFNGNLSKDPNGDWILFGDAAEREGILIGKIAAQRLRADTAQADSIRKDGVIEDLMQSNSDMTTCLAAAEQRIADLKSVLERMLGDDDMPVHWFAQRIDAALNPNPEAESHE